MRRTAPWRLFLVLALISGLLTLSVGAVMAQDPFGIDSDDFSSGTLNPAIWVFFPGSQGTMGFTGVGTSDAALTLSVPAGVTHDPWAPDPVNPGRNVPRVVQTGLSGLTDFQVEVKFLSLPSAVYQIQGLLIAQDTKNLIRVDFDRAPSGAEGKLVFRAGFIADAHTVNITPLDVPSVSPLWMRVARTSDVWTASYSLDGANWPPSQQITLPLPPDPNAPPPLTITSISLFAGNVPPDGTTPAPAFTASVDYFFNSASPISPEDPVGGVTHTLTTNVVGQGSVTLNPPGGTYEEDTVVTLTAVPAEGWVFSGWSGAATGSTNPTTVTMDADKTVTATFIQLPPQQFALTVNTTGQGTVTLDPPGGVYDPGAMVTATATAEPGWVFSGWSGAATGTQNPVSVTMDAHKTLTATFVQEGAADFAVLIPLVFKQP